MIEGVYHIPALLQECMDGLAIEPSGIYVDATFGGGGHSCAIIEHLGESGHLYSFDQDEDAMINAIDDARFTFVHSNFRYLSNFMRFYSVDKVDGILADLGVSFHHFDDKERGFSFRWEGPLDMRMNRKATRTAAWILSNYTEQQIADTLYLYGELRSARKIAAAIAKTRQQKEITTIETLLEIIKPFINPKQEKKELAQVFQALRIEVNDEIGALRNLLEQSLKVLKPGGNLAIITYHSLEDRLVKNFMRTGNFNGQEAKDFFGRNLSPFKLINSKPIIPSDDEVARNPRSRSAKLRIAKKL